VTVFLACPTHFIHSKSQYVTSSVWISHFMAVVFPHTQLRILPYHRCLSSIGEHTKEEFMEYVSGLHLIYICLWVMLFQPQWLLFIVTD